MDIRSFFKAKDKRQQFQSNSEAANSSTSDRTPAATTASPARADPGQNTGSPEAEAGHVRSDEPGGGDNNNSLPDLGEKDSGPSQPILPEYPKTFFGKQKRSFSSELYKRYSFIEYSKEADAVFCFACRHFQCNSGYTDLAYVSNGVRDGIFHVSYRNTLNVFPIGSVWKNGNPI